MTTSLALPSKALLVRLINLDGWLTLDTDDVSFATPTAKPTGLPPVGANTEVRVTFDKGLYQGSKFAYYNRLDIAQVLYAIDLSLPRAPTATRLSDLLPELNARAGIVLAAEDILDMDLPESGSVTMTMDPSCYVYIGSATLTLVPEP